MVVAIPVEVAAGSVKLYQIMKQIMKKCLALASALFMGCSMVSSQTTQVVKELNERGTWFPYVIWLQSDDKMEGYLRNINDNSVARLKETLQALDEDHGRAQALLKARTEIGGKRKGKKQDERLARCFKNLEVAKRAFDAAEQVGYRYNQLKRAITHELHHRKPVVMPAGKLMYFNYSISNAFAGSSVQIILDGRKGKHELKVQTEQMNWGDSNEEDNKTADFKEVSDSVFLRVREMVEQGKLYEVGRQYTPDVIIYDYSNWSLEIVFEQGSIVSSGYAEGPDNREALHAITDYLKTSIWPEGRDQ